MTSFIHLHVHSEYSLSEGLLRIEEIVKAAVGNNMPAVALTDNCNLFALIKFYQACEAAGIKPIIGAHVYIKNSEDIKKPHHLLLYCQNEQGYRNLTELLSRSYIEGQEEGRPYIEKEWLREKNQGLIVLAPCQNSDIGQALLANHTELAETLVEHWSGIFPKRFYLEITRCGRVNEDQYLQAVVKLAERKHCPLVATNDVRFLKAEDYEAHEARVCIFEGRELNDANRLRIYTQEQYFKSQSQMSYLFKDIPEALANSVEIAKRCSLSLNLKQVFLPKYPLPQGRTLEQYLQEMSCNGLQQRFSEKLIPEHYQNRLNEELKVILSMNFAGYFLIVADFIRWAKENGIPVGPGRGSGAGSLVAYSLKITDLDPLQYDLLFERFLNPERVSMPDFDIDFCMEGRDRVIDYVTRTYGRESVSQIITYGTMAAKAVVRDVGRVLGHPYGFVDKLAKLIPFEIGITLESALKQEELLKKRYQDEEEVRLLIDLARKLEGITRNVGKHAGGVVIAPSKLTDFTPLYCESTDAAIVTQFDKDDIEAIGLIKFDFLGLRTLTIIDGAVKNINQRRPAGEALLDITRIPFNDDKTFNLLRSCATTAIFQLESRGMKDLIRRLQPDIFEEIIALVALFRPGPLQSGMVDDFINRKHGRAASLYSHPKLEPILKPTYGIILYQEQVMQIAQVLSGYTLGGADLLRRAMGKKKPEEMAKQRAIFVSGAENNQVSRETATYIFDLMEKFAGYGFNKSHSATYAVLTYQTAWLKAHYPAAFMAAVLSSDMAHTDKVVVFIEECRHMGINVVPPSINESQYRFTVRDDNCIVYGLGAIKGLGEGAINSMISVREETGPFKDLFDLCARIDLRKASKRVLEALIRSGALDSLGEHRSALSALLEEATKASEQLTQNRLHGQMDLFGDSIHASDIMIRKAFDLAPWSEAQRLQAEKDTLGLYLTGHPINVFLPELKAMKITALKDVRPEKGRRQKLAGLVVSVRTLQTKKGDRMAFVTLDDRTARIEIAVFADLYRDKRELFNEDCLVIIEGEVALDDYSGGVKTRVFEAMDITQARTLFAEALKLTIPASISAQTLNGIIELLKTFKVPKTCPVKIVYEHDCGLAQLRLGSDWTVILRMELLEGLEKLIGPTFQISYRS